MTADSMYVGQCMRKGLSVLLAAFAIASVTTYASAAVIFVPIVIPIPVQIPSALTGGYSKIHNVAVISAIGSHFTVQNNTFWGTKKYPLDIARWSVDSAVEGMMRQYLGSRFDIASVPFDRSTLVALPNGPWDNSTGSVRKLLAAVPNDRLDAFIVVRPDLEYQAPGIAGLALQNSTDFINGAAPVVWANYEIDIVDAHTYETIAKAYSRVSLHRGQPDSFAGLLAGSSLQTDRLDLDEQQQSLLHALTNRLITASLIETLRSLQLGVTLPEPGARVLVPIPPDKLPYPQIKSVGIVSGIGDTLDFERFATIVGRSSKAVGVPEWQLDKLVEQEARSAMGRQFIVKDVPVDRSAFAQAALIDSEGKLNPRFPGLSPRPDVDAYLLFVKLREPLSDIMMHGTGLGMWHNVVAQQTGMFAYYAVVLIDAHTLKIIAATSAGTSPNYPASKPSVNVEDSLWPDDPTSLNAAEAEKIQRAIRELLVDTCRESMLRLGLTGMMIDGAPPSVPIANLSSSSETTQR
jgi:hypothetical protein